MMILHDYLPSQNAWKVRQLLQHLNRDYDTCEVSIFEGAGQHEEFLSKNVVGAVPVLEIDDGSCLAESNAILFYLAQGSDYLPADPWQQAQVLRWMFFEQDYVQSSIATLRHWSLTGKLSRRTQAVVESKTSAGLRSLEILEQHLVGREFLVDCGYTICDISVFAYVNLTEDTGIDLTDYPQVSAWLNRIKAQAGYLSTVFPYSIDGNSRKELP